MGLSAVILSFALTLLRLSALTPAAASRQLRQFDISFNVCPRPVFINCCRDFDFGALTTNLRGQPWPENSACELRANVRNETVEVRVPGFDITQRPTPVNVTRVPAPIEWLLIQYDPVGALHIWGRPGGIFCVCPPTPVAAPVAPTRTGSETALVATPGPPIAPVVSPVVAIEEDLDEEDAVEEIDLDD